MSPALTGAGPAFTADRVVMADYVYAHQAAADNVPYAAAYVFVITDFTLQGTPVTPIGLGTSYGLYFALDEIDHLSNGQAISDSGTIRLMADPTNNDGAPSVTLANQFAFANPAGVADDITLATGTLIDGSFAIANGIASKYLLETFNTAPGEAGFYNPGAGNDAFIELRNTNTPMSRQFLVQPDGSGITLVNGAIGSADILLDEPGTAPVLAAGLLGLAGLAMIRRRN